MRANKGLLDQEERRTFLSNLLVKRIARICEGISLSI